MEGTRDRIERVVGVRELVRVLDPAEPLGSRHEQAVVGADEEPSVLRPQRERAPVASDAWIDHRQVDALRHERQRVAEDDRTLEHVLGWDPVRNVDDLDFGRDPLDHAVTGAYEVVLETEVAQERHEHGA